uniref:uncharacterized protein LOC120325782 n=1 Tax=Styela clava TaxID=7725 RepID=UPI001939577B|nr:uncharacterized protein LOC120325782 [Styela clava]
MPTVYEFCSHVVANGDAGQLICDSSQCQGSPGEIGPTGAKGQKGEQGTAENLEERIRELEDSLTKTNQIIEALPRNQKDEWLQVDFGRPELVGGIITQERDAVAQWVAFFTVSCGLSQVSKYDTNAGRSVLSHCELR